MTQHGNQASSKNKQEVQDFVVELLEGYGCRGVKQLSQNNVRSTCPFHEDSKTTTSFSMTFNGEMPLFQCFSCHEAGNLAKLVSFIQGVSYKKAYKRIEKHTVLAGLDLKALQNNFLDLNKALQTKVNKKQPTVLPKRATNSVPLLKYMQKRSKMYHKVLNVPYIVKRYGLYYCDKGRMFGRVIMPININGEVVSYNDRTILPNIKQKSLHDPTAKFGEMLYGLDEAYGKKKVVLVEGAFDVFQIVSMFRSEKRWADYGCVALMGTSFSDDRLCLLMENFDEVIILLDNDKEGRLHTVSLYKILSEHMLVRSVTGEIPKGKDPGKCTKGQLKKAILSKGFVRSSYLSTVINNSNLKF
jgi:DNA primase